MSSNYYPDIFITDIAFTNILNKDNDSGNIRSSNSFPNNSNKQTKVWNKSLLEVCKRGICRQGSCAGHFRKCTISEFMLNHSGYAVIFVYKLEMYVWNHEARGQKGDLLNGLFFVFFLFYPFYFFNFSAITLIKEIIPSSGSLYRYNWCDCEWKFQIKDLYLFYLVSCFLGWKFIEFEGFL